MRFCATFGLLSFVACSSLVQAQSSGSVNVTTKPSFVLVEKGANSNFLNFDFLLENKAGVKLKLTSIQLELFDRAGNFVFRKVIDDHGVSPSLFTIPKLDLGPGETLNIYNPFYSFDPELDLAALNYVFTFSDEKEENVYKVKTVVKPTAYQDKTAFILPLKGRVVVEYGHDFYSPHRRIDLTNPIVRQVGLVANSARYANDLSIVDLQGNLYKGDKNRLENWFAYGVPLFAPGSGTIVTLVDGVPDNRFEDGKVVYPKEVNYEKTSSLLGNYIVIDHGHGEFSLFAHLKMGSFKIKKGELVRQGQQFAQIGFSGDADFVHSHYQLQSTADPAVAEGLPIYFRNFRMKVGNKEVNVSLGAIDSGDIVMDRNK